MLDITQSASEHLAELLVGREGSGLRLAVEKGGCAGLQYVLSVDSQEDGDHIFQCSGGKVLVDSESLVYLAGSILDYEGGLSGIGFRVQNPKASRNCGCGTSFEYPKLPPSAPPIMPS